MYLVFYILSAFLLLVTIITASLPADLLLVGRGLLVVIGISSVVLFAVIGRGLQLLKGIRDNTQN